MSVATVSSSTNTKRRVLVVDDEDNVTHLVSSALRADNPLVTLASSNVGSLGGLVALRDGLCHIAGSHLLDRKPASTPCRTWTGYSAPPARTWPWCGWWNGHRD